MDDTNVNSPTCPLCSRRNNMTLSTTLIDQPPTVLILDSVFPISDEKIPSNKADPIDVDNLPSTNKKKYFSPPKERSKETENLRINRQITIQGTKYQHLCTIMHKPGHFFSVLTYKDQTWIQGLSSGTIT